MKLKSRCSTNGKLIAFAREVGKATDTLYFRVLDPQQQIKPDNKTGLPEWNGWYCFRFPEANVSLPENLKSRLEGPQPELRLAGMDLLTVVPVSQAEAAANEAYDPTQVHPADAIFSVISVDPYLYLFRPQAVQTTDEQKGGGSLYLDRLKLRSSTEETPDGEVIHYALERAFEARFQGTALRDVPLNENDQQSYLDHEGRPFYEPTCELTFVEGAADGIYSICRVPTADSALVMWYIAICKTDEIALWAFSETSESVVDFGEAVYAATIKLTHYPDLSIVVDQAPALVFYAEQDPAPSAERDDVELLRAARLMLAVPVTTKNQDPLKRAVAVLDFGIDNAGCIPGLGSTDQPGEIELELKLDDLKDGKVEQGKFIPNHTNKSYAGRQRVIDGQTVTAVLLGQVQPYTDLALRSGEDGLVHLYYGGSIVDNQKTMNYLVPGEHEGLVAHYDPRVSRVTLEAGWTQLIESEQPNGNVYLIARQSGPIAEATVVIEDETFGGGKMDGSSPQPDLCRITITYSDAFAASTKSKSETWRGVSRDVRHLAHILNGGASGDAADPAVQDGQRPFFNVNVERQTPPAWLIRLPLQQPESSGVLQGNDDRPRLVLVSARPDMPLYTAKIEEDGQSAGGEQHLKLTLQISRGSMTKNEGPNNPFTVTYSGLPQTVDAWQTIFSGQAGDYNYAGQTSKTPLFALQTDLIPLLLYPNDDTIPEFDQVGVCPDENNKGKLCVTFYKGSGQEKVLEISNLDPYISQFVEELKENKQFNDLGLGISVAGTIDAADNTNPAGKMILMKPRGLLDLREMAVLFDVVLPPDPISGMIPTTDDGDKNTQFSGLMCRDELNPGCPPHLLGFYVTYDDPDATAWINTTNGKDEQTLSTNRVIAKREDPSVPTAGAWIREDPQPACTFDGHNNVIIPAYSGDKVLPRSRNLCPQKDWTLETWVKSDLSSSGRRRLITYRDKRNIDSHTAPQLDYRVGLDDGPVIAWQEPEQGASPSCFTVKKQGQFPPASSFTWTFWIAPASSSLANDHTGIRWVLQAGNPSAAPYPYLAVGLDAQGYLIVRTNRDGKKADHKSEAPLVNDDWSYIAVVGKLQSTKKGEWKLLLGINGQEFQVLSSKVKLPDISTPAFFTIGPDSNYSESDTPFVGKLLQLRFWKLAKTARELRKLAYHTLSGTESLSQGLVGEWPLYKIENNVTPGYPSQWEAKLNMNGQPLEVVKDSLFLSILGSVGRDGIKDTEVHEAIAMLPNGRWNHLALVYEAGGGLKLNSNPTAASSQDSGSGDWAEIEHSEALTLGNTFAISAWVRPMKGSTGGGIISQWGAKAGTDADNSYKLEIDPTGKLVFTINLRSGPRDVKQIVAKSENFNLLKNVNRACHVAVTFQAWEAKKQQSGQQETTYEYTIKLYRDGKEIGGTPKPQSIQAMMLELNTSQAPVYIGRRQSLSKNDDTAVDPGLFYGTIGTVSIWDGEELADFLNFLNLSTSSPTVDFDSMPGLVARWNFREGVGRIAANAAGGPDAKLSSSGLWTTMQETAELSFYANGRAVNTIRHHPRSFLPPLKRDSATQLILGNVDNKDVKRANSPGFIGQMAQLTLWQEARSPHQIEAQAHVPRTGDEPNLLAGWNFQGNDIDDNTLTIIDITGGQNNSDAVLKNRIESSNAPISIEGAVVRNVYGGKITEYSHSTVGRIATAAYVAVRQMGSDDQRAALWRCFLFDPHAFPVRGIEVGSVDLVYLGQIQTDPRLIGFIEGPPPVPSENLTRPYYLSLGGGPYMRYLDTATVTLAVQSSHNVSYTASVQHATGVDFKGFIGLGGSANINLESGILIAGKVLKTIAKKIKKIEGLAGLTSGIGAHWAYREGEGYNASSTASHSVTQGTDGDWEAKEDILNPHVGRRFQPQNNGLAVVESLTADLYAMVFHATGAALGTIALPNLEIPPDRNLVFFPMDSTYTKAGTLDGKVGLVNDPDYPLADAKRGSYFRPAEAYALASTIEQQHARDRAFAADVDVRHVAEASKLKGVSKHMPVSFETDPDQKKIQTVPKMGIVNRYVWTAGGGLDVKAESYASIASRSWQGTLAGQTQFGHKGEGKVSIWGGLIAGSYDISRTYAFDIQAGRDEATSAAVQLNVKVDGEAYLRKYDADHNEFLPGSAPGKVPAYRFMSFYLPPDKRNSIHLKNIVDPAWLALSRSQEARLMRQMVALRSFNPAWRILHRVTYIERVPPPVSSHPLFTDEKLRHTPVNLEGNTRLLELIDKTLAGKTPTVMTVSQAVFDVLNPSPTNQAGEPASYPPSKLEEIAPWWAQFLDMARPDSSGKVSNPKAAELLHNLVATVIRYCLDGYQTGVLPFKKAARSQTLIRISPRQK
jgi:large repetitive protein